MQIVPLQAVPNQTLTVNLNSQITQINVYQGRRVLFMDVLLDNAPIVYGVSCLNLNRIIREAYLGYSGDFAFIDSQGSDDPVYTGLGSRFNLAYLEPADLID